MIVYLHGFYTEAVFMKIASLSLCPQIPAFVIYGLTCVLGVFNHYIVPHMRKEMPWLLFSEPIVKPREWDAYEVSGTVVQHFFGSCKSFAAGGLVYVSLGL